MKALFQIGQMEIILLYVWINLQRMVFGMIGMQIKEIYLLEYCFSIHIYKITNLAEISTPKNSCVRVPGFFPRIVLRYIFIFELFLDSADGQKNSSKTVSEHCSKFRRVRPTRRGNHRRAASV